MIGHVLVNTDEVITYDFSSEHRALDLVGANNSISDVVALEDGVVELVVSSVSSTDLNSTGTASYGNFVKIRHANGQKTLYAHLKYGSVNVKKGSSVKKGEKIGVMGATGCAYGVHLHFEVRNSDESRENPYEYLWGIKQIRAPSLEKTVIEKKENNEENILKEDDSFSENIEETAKEVKAIISSRKEEIISSEKYLSNFSYNWYSIVDALKQINVDSSFENRKALAQKNGISNYQGSSSQNLKLLNLLKNGKLIA